MVEKINAQVKKATCLSIFDMQGTFYKWRVHAINTNKNLFMHQEKKYALIYVYF